MRTLSPADSVHAHDLGALRQPDISFWSAWDGTTLLGCDLINRETMLEAEGVLNGPEALAWGEWFQNLFVGGYAPATPADDQGFLQGRIPLWYTGSWAARDVRELRLRSEEHTSELQSH